ncbi:uncharacterized protein LOC121918977 [Sceloporus undulatus]|uniref:uncharacterized protein LOC121918977 n=1 Tax=Sceloporus undulatus TaxID=8520 RepID=UPI001C4B2A04|nr:uncharacterized protein LOC121918977 [Sceloporus undulatus]XP_042301049.1 uncharacterized protein LOC121918977 [Sceloporus undulatus]XP_042301050.1 uncharacterized protein LOC121918977 [Sceloporus undulatus]XP_042301051.1 uncharacterized protein LOC121918977 [Sceloporus undulatus]XP_042301052.1 uncharacterized protein LOC121918977 [Sceloporus undulatus]
MASYIHQLFIVAADLTFASAASCVLYGLVCVCLGSLISLAIFLCSFGAVKNVKRAIDQIGNAILMMVAKSTLGGLLLKKLDPVRFGVQEVYHLPEGDKDPDPEKECSSKTKVAQLPEAEEKYQKVMHARTESQLSLKGVSGVMKKPSVMVCEKEGETPNEYERKSMSRKQKNGFLSPALFIALLWAPVDIMCPCLKKITYQFLAALQKSQD